MQILKNINLANFNSFKINQLCNKFVIIEDKKELLNINLSKIKLILGSGSNVLITKKLKKILHIKNKGIQIISEDDNEVKIRVQAGEIWDDFVKFCVNNEFYGLENLSYIPGTVGAAPIQNIGAYGVEVKDFIDNVEFFNIKTKKFINFENNQCNFAYRDSIFKNKLKDEVIITSVDFILQKQKKFTLTYGNLKKYLSFKADITIEDVRNEVISLRRKKLPDPEIFGNSGSFFKNIVVNKKKFKELQEKYPEIPYFKIKDDFKIPAAWLIEKAGLKGYKKGKASVYKKHSLIIVNLGNAKARDIVNLANFIERKVFKKFGLQLTKEVNII